MSAPADTSVRDRLDAIGALSLGDNPSPDAIEAVLRRWAASLNGADDLRVQLERDALVALPALSAGAVDAALSSVRGHARHEGEGDRGGALSPKDPEPWPEAVDGEVLLVDLTETFNRFLALPDGAAVGLALWAVHAHAHDASPVSPVLAVTSPEKRCGKTTLLELLSALVPRPLPASNLTPAVVFRAVEKWHPTLLVDEADTFLRRGDELRGVLNSGHRRSLAFVPRCVGDDHEVRTFRTWAPKAVALIGELPDTLADRSIEIRMRRRAPGEEVERLRLDALTKLEPLRRRGWTWARTHEDQLRKADPQMAEGLHDRERDNWRPLLAIADAAGGPWPDRAREAARKLSEAERDDASLGTRLLADVRSILDDHPSDRIRSRTLVERLVALEESPWSEFKGRELSTVSLASFLRSFDISSKDYRFPTGTYKGYAEAAFEDAFRRYLDSPSSGTPHVKAQHARQSSNGGASDGFSGRNTKDDVAGRESAENPDSACDVADVAGREGDPAQEDRFADFDSATGYRP